MTLLVVRLLTPADYGLMALATSFLALLVLINEVGLGPALVQSKTLDMQQIRSAAGLITVINLVLSVFFLLSSPVIAWFFGEERLYYILSVLSVNFIIAAIGVTPGALLIRGLDFRRKTLVDASAQLCGGVVSLTLALQGYGVWALVWASLAITTVRSISLWVIAPQRIWPSLKLRDAWNMVGFGGVIAAQRIVWWFYSQADVLVVGKIHNTGLLGVYAVAMHLATLPQKKIGATINQVAFSGFSRIQTERELVRSYLVKAIRFLALIAFPVCFGMSSTATELVTVVLGGTWGYVTGPLQILCIIVPLRILSMPVNETLNALGKPLVMLTNLLITSVLMVAAILFGATYGIIGICFAWLIAFPLTLIVNVRRAGVYTGLTLTDFAVAIWRPLVAAFIMYAVVIGSRMLLPANLNTVAQLGALTFFGAATYIVTIALIDRQGCLDLLMFLGLVNSKQQSKT